MKTSNAMSQESLLKEISQWNEEMCQSELESALPKVVSMYQCCSGWAEHIRLLKILMEMFLPHISFTELEQSFFSQVLPKAVNLFDTLMDELSGQAGALSSQNTELRAALRNVLQTVIQLLETLSVCIRHLCSTHELLSVDSIHSLPASVLHMVKTTFTHCKESEMLYSGRMHLVADLLQALFKEAYSLQKQLMELLDRIVLEPEASEEEVVDMVSVLHNMLEICSVISNMDHALHANTWKFVIKQSLKHQSLLENHLRHNDIVCSLCQDILITFHSCLQLAEQMKLSGSQEDLNSAEYKLFQKTLKLSRFFGNTLVHYTKECMAFLAKSCSSLHQLCLQIYSKVSPGAYSSSVPETLREELARSLLVPMDPLIVQLLSYRPFVEVVLERNQELPADLTAAHCLLLISIMNKLQSEPEEVQNLWCRGSQFPEDSNRSSVIQALFLIFQGCYVELALPLLVPGVSSKGQAQNDISLYQHVCVHLCAFIASLPAPHFPELERSLLEAVLCPDISTVMLAVDAWCFLARYGTAELCAYHVTLIAHMIKRCPGSGQQVTHLALLLRRMLFLMAADHQVEFVKEFCSSETENLVLWQHISIKALTPALRKQVMQDIITGVTTQCSTWFNSGCCLQELELVNVALTAVLNVCHGVSEDMNAELGELVSNSIYQLWNLMDVKQVLNQPTIQKTLRLLLHLTANFIKTTLAHLVPQVVSFLDIFYPSNPTDDIQVAIGDFLASLGKIFLPPDCQAQVIPKLSSLFASLLENRSWIVFQHVLEAFVQFAEETSHEEVVPQSLLKVEVKSKVISFLNKTLPLVACDEESQLDRLKQEKSVLHAHFCRIRSNVLDDKPEDFQPSSKRARQETAEEGQFETALDMAESGLHSLESLLLSSPAPSWVALRLQALQTLVDKLNSKVQQNLLTQTTPLISDV